MKHRIFCKISKERKYLTLADLKQFFDEHHLQKKFPELFSLELLNIFTSLGFLKAIACKKN